MVTASRNRKGFTLLELSIVIIAIGLITGGVLAGQELITQGQTRRVMAQLQSFETAAISFTDKYNGLPGDLRNATSYSLGSNGDGDGLLCTQGWDAGCLWEGGSMYVHSKPNGTNGIYMNQIGGEPQQFFIQLGAAGMIPGSYITMPSGTNTDNNGLNPYYPRDVLGAAHLIAFSWAGKTYLRTGFSLTTNNGKTGFSVALLTGMQTYAMMVKRNGNDKVYDSSTTGPYPDAAIAGQRVIPLSVFVSNPNGNEGYVYNSVTFYDATVFDGNPASSSGYGHCGTGSPVIFNPTNTKACNILWEMDGI